MKTTRINFSLPNELKKVVRVSFIFYVVVAVILFFINKFYLLTFTLGYSVSLINLLKNNICTTYMIVCKLRNQQSRISKIALLQNMLTMVFFVPLATICFIKNPLYGVFSMVGIFMVKIFIIVLLGFGKEGGRV